MSSDSHEHDQEHEHDPLTCETCIERTQETREAGAAALVRWRLFQQQDVMAGALRDHVLAVLEEAAAKAMRDGAHATAVAGPGVGTRYHAMSDMLIDARSILLVFMDPGAVNIQLGPVTTVTQPNLDEPPPSDDGTGA